MGGFSIAPTGQQTLSQREVDAFMAEIRTRPKKPAPLPLAIRQHRMMVEKNAGYPKHMFHASLDPRLALSEEEEEALRQMGYGDQYIPRTYPKFLHRRNMDAKFEPHFDPATGILQNEPFVETRLVRSPEEEKVLQLMKPKNGQSDWFDELALLPPIEDGPEEDPAITIANLQGQIAALQSRDTGRKGKGE